MTLIPIHMLQRAELAMLGHNLGATVRHDRRQHLAAANRSLRSVGEAASWFPRPTHRQNSEGRDDDRDDFDSGAAGALVPA